MDHSNLPDTICIGRLATAARLAGYSVTLVYHSFPAPLLAEIWKYHAEDVGEGEALYIANRRDLLQLTPPTKPSETQAADSDGAATIPLKTPRLLFVRDARLLGEIAWAAELSRFSRAGEVTIPPTVFALAGAEDDVDAPGARLDLYASPEEEQKIVTWLQQVKKDRGEQHDMSGTPKVVRFLDPLKKFFWPTPQGSEAGGLSRLRDCQVLQALLAGACVLRNHDSDTSLEVTDDDYETGYRLLTSKLARPADEPADPLVVDMVGRTNEYLRMLHCEAKAPTARSDDASYQPRQVTRKVLTDLGSIHSQAVRQLVRFLLKQTKGFQSFRKLGLLPGWPQESDWQAIQRDAANKKPKEINRLPGVQKLLAALKPWTEKQVRTRFHRQYKDGTIDGDKKGSGPWIYAVPETLIPGRSAFHNLSKPAVISAELAAYIKVDMSPKRLAPLARRLPSPLGKPK